MMKVFKLPDYFIALQASIRAMSSNNQQIHPWHTTEIAPSQWFTPQNSLTSEVQAMQTTQRKAVPMVSTANQGMVQTLLPGGPGQTCLPQYQSIPPPPPRTVFDITPTLQNNVRSILRNEMQSLIKEELGTMIQGALKSTFASIKSEFQSDIEPSSSSRTVYIQDKSPSRNRRANSSLPRKAKPRESAHTKERTTERTIDDRRYKSKPRPSKSKTSKYDKDTESQSTKKKTKTDSKQKIISKSRTTSRTRPTPSRPSRSQLNRQEYSPDCSPTRGRKRTRSDSRRDNKKVKADNAVTSTTQGQRTKSKSPKWKSERSDKWTDWKKGDWEKADWKKSDWKKTDHYNKKPVATSSNAIPVTHGDVEERLKSPISVFKGDVGNIAETIQAWCQKYAPTTQQPSIEMTAYVEWILRNSHIPNVEEFTMECFTTDEHTPGKIPEEPDQTYYCITPNYFKYSTDQPQAAIPSKSITTPSSMGSLHHTRWSHQHLQTPGGKTGQLAQRGRVWLFLRKRLRASDFTGVLLPGLGQGTSHNVEQG